MLDCFVHPVREQKRESRIAKRMEGIRAGLQSSRNQNNCFVELSSLKHDGTEHVARLEVACIHS